MSERLTVQSAIAAVMHDVQGVAKKDRNTAQGFNFRGIDAVINAVGPALREHGVVVMPTVLDYHYNTVEVGKNRTAMGHMIVKVTYTFTGPAGDSLACTVLGEAMDSGDKATPKAMSVAFRTALLQALALPTDEPDPDASTYERAPAKPQATPKQIAEWTLAIAEASTVDDLMTIGNAAGGHDMTDQARAALRTAYVERKQSLEGAQS